MAEERVNGPEDSFVKDVIKQLPQEQLPEITWCFQDHVMDLEEALCVLEEREIGFLAESGCENGTEVTWSWR